MSQADMDVQLEALKASFSRHTWYALVLDSSPIVPDARLLFDHLTWLKAREASGDLVLTGLRFGEDGKPVDGLTVLRADSLESARQVASSDPFVVAGAVFTLHRWDVAAGSLPLSVRLSDRSIGVA